MFKERAPFPLNGFCKTSIKRLHAFWSSIPPFDSKDYSYVDMAGHSMTNAKSISPRLVKAGGNLILNCEESLSTQNGSKTWIDEFHRLSPSSQTLSSWWWWCIVKMYSVEHLCRYLFIDNDSDWCWCWLMLFDTDWCWCWCWSWCWCCDPKQHQELHTWKCTIVPQTVIFLN